MPYRVVELADVSSDARQKTRLCSKQGFEGIGHLRKLASWFLPPHSQIPLKRLVGPSLVLGLAGSAISTLLLWFMCAFGLGALPGDLVAKRLAVEYGEAQWFAVMIIANTPLHAAVVFGVLYGVAKSRKPPEGKCAKCGYDLTGNMSGVCPECGCAIEQSEKANSH